MEQIEIWATCDPCSREFYVPHSEVQDLRLARCPVCGGVPRRMEARGAGRNFEVTVDRGGDGAPGPDEPVLSG